MRATNELTRRELDELKCNYLFEIVENPSYFEIANSDRIADEIIHEHYAGVMFSSDDFFCNIKEA